jgi:hypothetical protein
MPPDDRVLSDFAERLVAPADAQLLIDIIESSAQDASDLCAREFLNGNAALVQGWIRRQYIHDRSRSARFSGELLVEARSYRGRTMDDAARQPFFTLYRGDGIAAVVHRMSHFHPIPPPSEIRRLMGTPHQDLELHMFPDYINFEEAPVELDRLYIVRYELDEDDPSGASVARVDVVVLTQDQSAIAANVCDLRDYAASAAAPVLAGEAAATAVPMSLRSGRPRPGAALRRPDTPLDDSEGRGTTDDDET